MTSHHDYIPEDRVLISRHCPECGSLNSVSVLKSGYHAWQAGELIQRALPDLTDAQREILMTGICSFCWDIIFLPEA